MDALQRNYGKTTYYQVRNIRLVLDDFYMAASIRYDFCAIEESEARRIWIMIVNFFGIVNVLSSPISSYAMIYKEVRKRRTSNMNNFTASAQAKLKSTIAKTTGFITAALLFTIALGVILLNLRLRFPTSRLDFLVEISRTKKDQNHVVRPQALLKKMLWR